MKAINEIFSLLKDLYSKMFSLKKVLAHIVKIPSNTNPIVSGFHGRILSRAFEM
jgi:hypothetical protein